MARKHHAKHSKNTILASASARSFSKLSVGAASAVAVASLALSAAPALAQAETAPVQQATPASTKQAAPADAGKKNGSVVQEKQVKEDSSKPQKDLKKIDPAKKSSDTKQISNGEANREPAQQANPEITLSKETKDTLPNMYAWGSSDNVYIESGQDQNVKFILKPVDGVAVTKVAIFPNDNIDINGGNAKQFIEYRSDNTDNQPYSGKYSFVTNGDKSATLTMSPMFRRYDKTGDKGIANAGGYAANRCIYVYGTKDGEDVLLYKTNIARAATLIPPKKLALLF